MAFAIRLFLFVFSSFLLLQTVAASTSTYSSDECVTHYGNEKQKQPLRRSSRTTSRDFTVTLTSTPTISETPSAATTTQVEVNHVVTIMTFKHGASSVAAVKTIPQKLVAQSTTTVFTSITKTFTTSVHFKPTVTVPTSPGFTAIQSNTLVIKGGGGVKRRNEDKHAALDSKHVVDKDRLHSNSYPVGISCLAKVHVVTYITEGLPAENAVTHTAEAPLKTVTITNMSTSVSTARHGIQEADKMPDIHDGVADIATKTSTVTIFKTKTITSEPSVHYDMCERNNRIGYVGGYNIYFYEFDTSVAKGPVVHIKGQTHCCAACAETDLCYGFSWFRSPLEKQCTLIIGNKTANDCEPKKYFWGFDTQHKVIGSRFIIGNGQCGQAQYEGN